MINSNFGFTPLREVWLGDCYPETWYDHLPNKIADPFRQITEWTKEDTKKLQNFLESLGIIVRRPVFESIDNHITSEGVLSKPPITPRDHYLTLGSTLYSLHRATKKDPWQHVMNQYISQGLDVQSPVDMPINCVSPPSVVRVGRDLYIDIDSHLPNWGYVCEWLIDIAKDYRVNLCDTSGHSDGIFCPIGPGNIVSTHYKVDYTQSFPGWKLFRIPSRLHNFLSPKNWMVDNPTIDNNEAFSQHILNTAASWVGNFSETVFEVNMLVIDEKNVVAMKEYPPLVEWLEKQGITVHHFDFRTRSFWDGGWHCLTLDIHREDTKLDLFPLRGNNGVYWREVTNKNLGSDN
jgi:hypothetical protein